MRAIIDFSEVAKEHCAFDRNNLRIFITDDNGNLLETRPYNTYEYERVLEMKIPVIERMDTSSCRISVDPSRVILLSRLKVK